ncbi:MAG: M18 family aminopeptidase [Clostridium sp.]
MDKICSFLNQSVSPYHAVKQVKEALKVAGFQSLEEENLWQLEPGKNYYVTRNESSLLAFSMPKEKPLYYHLCASHSDFPTFRIKKARKKDAFYAKAEIEGYGGMIHTSWFDRPLGLAGRVMKKTKEGISSVLIAPDKNVFVIPNLSIHFNREINQGYKHNVHVDLQPLYGGSEAELMTLLREEAGCKGDEEIVDMDLILTVRQPAVAAGVKDEFLLTPRFDDLGCVYTTLQGFLRAQDKLPKEALSVFCLFDNEEVGSGSRQGALSNFLPDVLERICLSYGMTKEEQICAESRSFLLSADNAHAVHPNHPEKSDDEFPVVLNGGVVIKYNASQRYTTTGMTGGVFGSLCEKNDIKTQLFVNRADMPGGSTLGNL